MAIQHEGLRSRIDSKFTAVHDELTAAYYGGVPFRTFGILDKAKFDKYHGLIFVIRDIVFHAENQKQPLNKRIPESKYNTICDDDGVVVGNKATLAQSIRDLLAAEGIVLGIN